MCKIANMVTQHSMENGPGGEMAGPERYALRNSIREELAKIHPEYLDAEELRYELYLRNLTLSGTDRERTGRLSAALIEERRANSRPPRSHVILSVDVAQTVVKIAQTQTFLESLTLDECSLKRVGTILAHLEGRVGRMFPESEAHGNIVRDLREQVEGYLNAFIDKYLELRQGRSRRGAESEAATGTTTTSSITTATTATTTTTSAQTSNMQASTSAQATSSNELSVTGNGQQLIDLTEYEPEVSEGPHRPIARPLIDATFDISNGQRPPAGEMRNIDTSTMASSDPNLSGRSTDWSANGMPSEAVFSSFPIVSTLTSEQLRALERTCNSLDGSSFIEDWRSAGRAHSTQHPSRDSLGSDQRNVRFRIDEGRFRIETTLLENLWTPHITQIVGIVRVALRRSDTTVIVTHRIGHRIGQNTATAAARRHEVTGVIPPPESIRRVGIGIATDTLIHPDRIRISGSVEMVRGAPKVFREPPETQ